MAEVAGGEESGADADEIRLSRAGMAAPMVAAMGEDGALATGKARAMLACDRAVTAVGDKKPDPLGLADLSTGKFVAAGGSGERLSGVGTVVGVECEEEVPMEGGGGDVRVGVGRVAGFGSGWNGRGIGVSAYGFRGGTGNAFLESGSSTEVGGEWCPIGSENLTSAVYFWSPLEEESLDSGKAGSSPNGELGEEGGDDEAIVDVPPMTDGVHRTVLRGGRPFSPGSGPTSSFSDCTLLSAAALSWMVGNLAPAK